MEQKEAIRQVQKPWGHELIWAHTPRYVGKILSIRAGQRLSLQYHQQKDETIYVLSGRIDLEVGEQGGPLSTRTLEEGDVYHIKPLTVHRMIAVEDARLLEVSTPELEDVVRLEDVYGRAGTSAP